MDLFEVFTLYRAVFAVKKLVTVPIPHLEDKSFQENPDQTFEIWMEAVADWIETRDGLGTGDLLSTTPMRERLWGSDGNLRTTVEIPLADIDGVQGINKSDDELGYLRNPATDVVFFSQIEPTLEEEHPLMRNATAEQLWNRANLENNWSVTRVEKQLNGANIIPCTNGAHRFTLARKKMLDRNPAHKVRVVTAERIPSEWLVRIASENNILFVSFAEGRGATLPRVLSTAFRPKNVMIWPMVDKRTRNVVIAWRRRPFGWLAKWSLGEATLSLNTVIERLKM